MINSSKHRTATDLGNMPFSRWIACPQSCLVITPPPLRRNPGLNPQRSKHGHQTRCTSTNTAPQRTLQAVCRGRLPSLATAHHAEGGTGLSTLSKMINR